MNKPVANNSFLPVFFIWLITAILLVITKWQSVANFDFLDSDDLARLVEYHDFIHNFNWYLTPNPQLHPELGMINHWTRLPDLPFALVFCFFDLFVSQDLAFTLTNSLVPVLYLLLFMYVNFKLTTELFGNQTAVLTAILPLTVIIIIKFWPGALDLHNLQYVLLSLFAWLFLKEKSNPYLSSLVVALSLWVGLENMYAFAGLVGFLALYAIFKEPENLKFFTKFFASLSLFIAIFMLLNRPYDEFFIARFDAISLPFLLLALAGCASFLVIDWLFHKNGGGYKLFIPGVAVFFIPILIAYPELTGGGYYHYPPLLLKNWLSTVTEARSMLDLSLEKPDLYSFFNMPLICALFAPLCCKRNKFFFALYFAFLVNFLFGTFWQLRVLFTASVLALPLQAIVLVKLTNLVRPKVFKVLLVLPFLPVVIGVILQNVISKDGKNEQNQQVVQHQSAENEEYLPAVKFFPYWFKKFNVPENARILASTNVGYSLLVSTRNKLVMIGYHRNFKHNLAGYKIFLSEDDTEIKNLLIQEKVDFIIADATFAEQMQELNPDKHKMLINRLFDEKNVPSFLQFLDNQGQFALYRVNIY